MNFPIFFYLLTSFVAKVVTILSVVAQIKNVGEIDPPEPNNTELVWDFYATVSCKSCPYMVLYN